jgi:hypothetical protein
MQKIDATFINIILLMCLIGTIGWCKNIYKLTQCDFEAPYKAEVIHTVGIIPVVGWITGWLDLGK